LLSCKHSNGGPLRVIDEGKPYPYVVSWPDKEIDISALNITYDQTRATEDGAEAIALLLSIHRTSYTAVQRAIKGTGIDYWLGYKDNLNNPFAKASRLEVSGLYTESDTNTVRSRVKGKLDQTLPSDGTFSVYVIVVEFGQPYATMVLKK